MTEKITLSGVPETMLQNLYARAKESKGRGAIRDRKAEELIGHGFFRQHAPACRKKIYLDLMFLCFRILQGGIILKS